MLTYLLMKNILVKKKTKKGENGTDRFLQIPLMSGLSKQNHIEKGKQLGVHIFSCIQSFAICCLVEIYKENPGSHTYKPGKGRSILIIFSNTSAYFFFYTTPKFHKR